LVRDDSAHHFIAAIAATAAKSVLSDSVGLDRVFGAGVQTAAAAAAASF
jgi:hypothetical protein